MDFADWIPTIINVGSSLFGGGGSSAPSAPSSSYLDWGSILKGVGQLASRVEMVPGAGALDEDIRKANRFNLLAGLLGGAGQIAGSQMEASEKRGLGQDVAAILGGKGTYTGEPIKKGEYPESLVGKTLEDGIVPPPAPQSKSAALFGLMNKYPNQASQILELGTKIQDAEGKAATAAQERQFEMMDLARKSGGQPITYLDALTIAEKEGTPPELRAQQAQILMDQQSKDQAARLEPFRSEFEKRGITLPTSRTESTAKMPSIIAPSVTTPSRSEQPSIQGPEGINIQATPSSQYEEASRLLGQKITPPSEQPGTYGKPPQTLEEIQAATIKEAERKRGIAEREQTSKEEQNFASQLKDIQTSEGYKQNVEKLRGQSSTLNKLAALTTEIAKRPNGRIKPQDRVQLAKLAINAIEPGLSVNEGEAAQALIPDSMWWNSAPGRLVASVFGRNEIPVDSLDALLKTTGAYVKAQQNAAFDYLENEVKPTYESFLQGDKLINAVQRAIPETDPFEVVGSALDSINQAKGIGGVPTGYVKQPKQPVEPFRTQTTTPITKNPKLMGYTPDRRPVIGIVRR
jgi:hypothetical protein